MSDFTQVYLITGFLGSGKTTFLNRIIKRFPPDKKLTLLVNEFGEVGVDGTLVEGDDIDMMEISKGSIFCVCVKTDFIKGLYELNSTIRPDVMLIGVIQQLAEIPLHDAYVEPVDGFNFTDL